MSSSSSRRSRSSNAAAGPGGGQSKVTSFFARAKSQPVPGPVGAKSAKASIHAAPSSDSRKKAPTKSVTQADSDKDDGMDDDDAIDFSQEFDDNDTSSAHLSASGDDGGDDSPAKANNLLESLLPTPVASSSPPNVDSADRAPRPAPSSIAPKSSSSTTATVPFFKSPAPVIRRSRFSPPPPPQKPKPAQSLDPSDQPALARRPVSPLGSAAASAHDDAHLPSSADQTMALLFGASSSPGPSSSSQRASSLRRMREPEDTNDQYQDNDGDEIVSRRRPKMRRKDILSTDPAPDESLQWAVTFVSSYLSTPDERATARAKLRTFDLDLKFGPTVGIPRLTRWIRASDRGLDPDPHLGDVLRAIDMMADMPASKIAKTLGMDVQEVEEVKEMALNVFAEYGTLV